MARIGREMGVVTLINVFEVAPEDQGRLVELLVRATDEVMSERPGYVSANIHRSFDGTRVTNYAQWRSREDLEAMLSDPVAAEHMREAGKIAAGYEPHLYEVAFAHGVD